LRQSRRFPLATEARSLTRPSSLPRAKLSERWDRPGWRQEFTVAGGRLRAEDPVSVLPRQRLAIATRLLSQACFSIASDGDIPALSDKALRWATVARKILQRGARPAIAARADEIIRTSLGDVPAVRASQVEAAIGWSDQGWRLADEYELDPTYERPLWDWVADRAPTLARWLIPQASLESLAGELDGRVSARWVDFLFCAPWLNRTSSARRADLSTKMAC
jgi:hypothetical protein